MKKLLLVVTCFALTIGLSTIAFAGSKEKLKRGITVDGENVGGLSAKKAKKAVHKAVKEKSGIKVVITVGEKQCETTLYDLGYEWSNEEIVDEALEYGKAGSVIKRYIDNKELKAKGKNYPINMKLNHKKLEKSLEEKLKEYEVPVTNASLKATGHGFKIIKGKNGCAIDMKKTIKDFENFVEKKWDEKSEIDFDASTKVTKPKYNEDALKEVSDEPMGSFTTNVSGGIANEKRNLNIKNGVEKLDGHTIYPGESFSCNEQLVPWTEDNGWHPAGTYVDGEVQDSLGGGICQVSTTLYNALLRAEIKITKRFSHSMAVGYVDLAADAALAGDYKDLVFENDTDAPIYIQGKYNGGSITFNVYGHDTRPEGHRVEFVSEKIKDIPIKDKVVKDSSKPKGYREVEDPGHEGHVAKLWKITYEDGKEVSKELLHTSTYAMAPKKIVEGTAKGDTPSKKDDSEKESTHKTEETKKKSSDE